MKNWLTVLINPPNISSSTKVFATQKAYTLLPGAYHIVNISTLFVQKLLNRPPHVFKRSKCFNAFVRSVSNCVINLHDVTQQLVPSFNWSVSQSVGQFSIQPFSQSVLASWMKNWQTVLVNPKIISCSKSFFLGYEQLELFFLVLNQHIVYLSTLFSQKCSKKPP